MQSTTSGSALSRSRSLRKPSTATGTATSSTNSTGTSADGPRNVSPSRLPVKGQVSAPTAANPTRTARSATTSAATAKSRPLSGVFARITSSSARQREKESPEPSPTARPARAASIRQPSTSARPATSGAAGPAAVSRPTTSSGITSSRRAVSGASTGQGPISAAGPGTGPAPGPRHARAKSSVTALSGATTLRPPSQTSTGSSSTTTAIVTTTDRSRPPLSSLTRRNPTAVAAPPSPTTTNTTTTATFTPRRRTSLTSKTPPPPPASPKAKPRPQQPPSPSHPHVKPNAPLTKPALSAKTPFTTHQQHFTPAAAAAGSKQANKPLTSALLAPPSPSKLPANVALSAETARLQTELLQLSLLHRRAHHVLGEWAGDARGKLRGRWDAVREMDGRVAGLEGEVAEREGLRGLRDWGLHGGMGLGLGLEDKIAVLDGVVNWVWGLGGEGGRYERVVRGFEGWVGRVEAVLRARESGESEGEGEGGDGDGEGVLLVLVPELDTAWKGECAALARRLDEWRRKLRELGGVPAPDPAPGPASAAADGDGDGVEADAEAEASALARILGGCRALVHGMLEELEVMEQIERETAAAEMRWVREMNRKGLGARDEDGRRAGAIWRAF